jgi:hypothetical protein
LIVRSLLFIMDKIRTRPLGEVAFYS